MELTDLQLHYIDTVYVTKRQEVLYDVEKWRTILDLILFLLLFVAAYFTGANAYFVLGIGLVFAYNVWHLYQVFKNLERVTLENKKQLGVYDVD